MNLPSNLHKYLYRLKSTKVKNFRLFTIVEKSKIRAGLGWSLSAPRLATCVRRSIAKCIVPLLLSVSCLYCWAHYASSWTFTKCTRARQISLCWWKFWAARDSTLNKITIKNKYLIPLIADLFDQLGKAGTLSSLTCNPGTIKCASPKEKHVQHLR